MFRHEGPLRSAKSNGILAGYLAFIAGFSNSAGFVLVGTFTSHVTGSVGRLADDLSREDFPAATFAGLLVLAFFVGAFLASSIIEARPGARARGYGIALLIEAAALAGFVALTRLANLRGARALDAQAAILCIAMGMQNSLVTNLSGAVIRTTHLTGVVTDLGIDAARWLRWFTHRNASEPAARPATSRTAILLTIACAFVVGAVIGSALTTRWGASAVALPALAVFAVALYALRQPRAEPAS